MNEDLTTMPVSNDQIDHPREEAIKQSENGIPDDGSSTIKIDEAEIQRVMDDVMEEKEEAETEAHPS